ncbi:DUF2231 domain-containing protein [Phenylobacterium sp.]|uniref:DUF2231 domain-containing protein n=1 Tax=Phenylobacterium sp. TaxID=1871053 RepID=UPI002F9215D1
MSEIDHSNPKSTAKVGGHPLHPMIVPFPIAFFISALVTDIIYLANGREGFAEASMWLLGAGLASAALAAILGLIDFSGDRRVRAMKTAWAHMIANVMVVALEAVSFYLRAGGDFRDAVAPSGVTLSFVSVVILAVSGWLGGELVYRGRVGIEDSDAHDHARVRVRS